jgi:hypothetical protein
MNNEISDYASIKQYRAKVVNKLLQDNPNLYKIQNVYCREKWLHDLPSKVIYSANLDLIDYVAQYKSFQKPSLIKDATYFGNSTIINYIANLQLKNYNPYYNDSIGLIQINATKEQISNLNQNELSMQPFTKNFEDSNSCSDYQWGFKDNSYVVNFQTAQYLHENNFKIRLGFDDITSLIKSEYSEFVKFVIGNHLYDTNEVGLTYSNWTDSKISQEKYFITLLLKQALVYNTNEEIIDYFLGFMKDKNLFNIKYYIEAIEASSRNSLRLENAKLANIFIDQVSVKGLSKLTNQTSLNDILPQLKPITDPESIFFKEYQQNMSFFSNSKHSLINNAVYYIKSLLVDLLSLPAVQIFDSNENQAIKEFLSTDQATKDIYYQRSIKLINFLRYYSDKNLEENIVVSELRSDKNNHVEALNKITILDILLTEPASLCHEMVDISWYPKDMSTREWWADDEISICLKPTLTYHDLEY